MICARIRLTVTDRACGYDPHFPIRPCVRANPFLCTYAGMTDVPVCLTARGHVWVSCARVRACVRPRHMHGTASLLFCLCPCRFLSSPGGLRYQVLGTLGAVNQRGPLMRADQAEKRIHCVPITAFLPPICENPLIWFSLRCWKNLSFSFSGRNTSQHQICSMSALHSEITWF